MVDRRWVQLGGVSGILFIVLLILSGVTSGNSPSSSDSTAKIVSYIQSNRSTILLSQVLGAVVGVPILVFAAVFSQILRDRDPHSPLSRIALGSGSAATAIGVVSSFPLAVLALVSDQPNGLGDGSAARMFFILGQQVLGGAIELMLVVFLAATGVGMLRRAFAAPWLGWLALVFALVNLAAGVLAFTTTKDVGGLAGILGLAGFGIVVLSASIYMLRYRPEVAGAA